MRRNSALGWIAAFAIVGLANGFLIEDSAAAGLISGKVVMPDVCSPEISPAVVILEPTDKSISPVPSTAPNDVALVNQRGLQFVPRVQALPLGSTIRFTNEDRETHNVHILSPGHTFNESMAPGQPREYKPTKPGVIRLGCDVHSHMHGYVVVSESPFVQVCSAMGNYRFRDVPEGAYTLTVWHEMGDSLKTEIQVEKDADQKLADLTVTAKSLVLAPGEAEPIRPWSEVIDRIGLMLSAGLDCAAKPEGYKKARKLAEDAYFVEFEASDMETAVRNFLGIDRASEIERQFRALFRIYREVSEKRVASAVALDLTRPLLLSLAKASDDLNRKGVTDSAHLKLVANATTTLNPTLPVDTSLDPINPGKQLQILKKSFEEVAALANKNDPDEASALMTQIYFEEFEPLERYISVRRPQDVQPLERTFSAIRAEIGSGRSGPPLAEKLLAFQDDVKHSVTQSGEAEMGSFASAFGVSLITILREGVEIILLLAMLFALVAKTGQVEAKKAIYWGVGLATAASGLTALALNRLVYSAQGQSRETLEGVVMLAASAVLFYVSYWLISQSESKRWMTFLKEQTNRGANLGTKGFLTLATTAFLAVYREGAEIALMYQAMIAAQRGSQQGLTGLAAGLLLGLVLLVGIAYLFRATTVKLPLRPFFQATGGFLFVLSVIFAGNAVFELQQSGILKTTAINWVGSGLPILGLHPSLQAVSVQGLLVVGALLALLLMLTGSETLDPTVSNRKLNVKPTAGVGV